MNTLLKAIEYYGLKEVQGKKSNPKLLDLIQSELKWVDDDSSIAWCALFATVIFKISGLTHLIPDKPYAARSWINLRYNSVVRVVWEDGDDVLTMNEKSKPGDIVIFWRGSKKGWKGHFAWWINEFGDKIRVLGGNQDDAVNIKAYRKDRVLIIMRIVSF